jgi:CheY-like chemotaxis protein
MGLAAVFGTVRGHSGAITVKSVEKKGSVFSLYFPCNRDSAVKDDRTSVSTATIESLNVMVIDDENIVRSIIVEMLKLQKASVIECSGFSEAFEIYKEKYKEIDLVFIDMIMPEKNGLETFRELKKINNKIRAVVISGYTMNDEISQTIKEGAVGFIQKPVSMKVLMASMKDALLVPV